MKFGGVEKDINQQVIIHKDLMDADLDDVTQVYPYKHKERDFS